MFRCYEFQVEWQFFWNIESPGILLRLCMYLMHNKPIHFRNFSSLFSQSKTRSNTPWPPPSWRSRAVWVSSSSHCDHWQCSTLVLNYFLWRRLGSEAAVYRLGGRTGVWTVLRSAQTDQHLPDSTPSSRENRGSDCACAETHRVRISTR